MDMIIPSRFNISKPRLKFSKMHGAGNDFVILDLRGTHYPDIGLCRFLTDRHKGVGCDLILGVDIPKNKESIASYHIWSSDGSKSRQCGNGARCVAAWLIREGLACDASFSLDSPSGLLSVEITQDGEFCIGMGIPNFLPSDIPLFNFAQQQLEYTVRITENDVTFSALSMGNPHAVIEVDDIETAAVQSTGPAIQQSLFFEPTVNVGFVQITSRKEILLRVFEFGAGETLACGSGACAAVAALIRKGKLDNSVTVILLGGKLKIEWKDETSPIFMTGPVDFTYEGEIVNGNL
ncbi:diaminopimelate epimerase [Xenorhabdus eapokensis]|uniref:Diaminopimelate epimerase n=2 Tax=Xenorhabdus eapokensis TaxID=1873482 RepID=A0A1Q5TFS9_9GAMM|nr:diaminopimelate epimerase [Xenorhabdus eapokensis]